VNYLCRFIIGARLFHADLKAVLCAQLIGMHRLCLPDLTFTTYDLGAQLFCRFGVRCSGEPTSYAQRGNTHTVGGTRAKTDNAKRGHQLVTSL